MANNQHEQLFNIFEEHPRKVIIIRISDAISKLPDTCDWQITIKRKVKQRSLDQNNMLHAMFRDIAAQTGDSPAKVKEDIKTALGLKVAITGIDGKVREINKPTEEYEVEEMTDFITRIIALCDEIDIDVAPHRERHEAAQQNAKS